MRTVCSLSLPLTLEGITQNPWSARGSLGLRLSIQGFGFGIEEPCGIWWGEKYGFGDSGFKRCRAT